MGALLTVIVIAVSLALDALSVSVAGGLKARHATAKDALKVAWFFGGFQAVMPLIGWVIGGAFKHLIIGVSGWIAFILLTLIGLKMIKEALGPDDPEAKPKDMLGTKTLTMLAIATSIDALVVGVTLNLVNLPLVLSVVIIGVVTFALSLGGFMFGKKLGSFFQGKIEIFGGLALIGIGIKLLLA